MAVGLLTLILLAFGIINFMGARSWATTKAEMIEKGYPVTWDELLPPEIADEDNFAMSPVFRELVEKGFKTQGDVARKKVDEEMKMRFSKQFDRLEVKGFSALTHIKDLDKRIKDQPEDDAEQKTVEEMLDESKQGFEDVELALQRSGSRFAILYENHLGALLPHLRYIKRMGKCFLIRSVYHLEEGDTDKAFHDLIQVRKLADTLDDEPILISQLVDIVLIHFTLVGIKEGLARAAWTEDQMRTLLKELKNVNMLEQFERAMQGENLFQITFTEALIGGSSDTQKLLFQDMEVPQIGMLPKGFFQLNMAVSCNVHMDHFTKQEQIDNRFISDSNHFTDEEIKALPWYAVLSKMLLPAFGKAETKFINTQAHLHMALMGLEVELYFKKHGKLPESFDDLKLPEDTLHRVDPVSGNSLVYERLGDTNYKIYSFGDDRVDGGGKKGDWEWWRVPPEEEEAGKN
ncbi:hypothetical protein N9059_01495 [bacterium]|nr:hypothetical protein [bacterium]